MRRLLIPSLTPGRLALPDDQAHHARDVLRLRTGDKVELFTPAGQSAIATLVSITPSQVLAEVHQIQEARPAAVTLTIASAVPKAARADWMIEKLSELGAATFIPLLTDRSVVHPEGKNKLQRWQRLAEESAKQSKRPGVMQIAAPTRLPDLFINPHPNTTIAPLSTSPGARPLSSILNPQSSLLLLIGPEGGWSDAELSLFADHHLTPITLGTTILRVETAAIAAAAVVNALLTEKAKT
jgi:16S rRNA (uracil1498-N3)-methyltransferase